MKSKMPLFFILLSGYISSLAVYLFWYYTIPYYSLKKITDAPNLEIVLVGITILYLFLYLFILSIRSFQTPWKCFLLVSVITLLTFFLIPSVYYARYHFERAYGKKHTEKYRKKEIEATLKNPITIINVAEKAITELQAKLKIERNENDKLRKQLNETITKIKSLEEELKTKGYIVVQAKSNKDSSEINTNSEVVNIENQEIIFKVQIISSDTRLATNSPQFKNLKNIWEYKENGLYKYTVGNQKDLKSAFVLQSEYRRKGFVGAFVVAFRNEKRIPMKKAMDMFKMHGNI